MFGRLSRSTNSHLFVGSWLLPTLLQKKTLKEISKTYTIPKDYKCKVSCIFFSKVGWERVNRKEWGNQWASRWKLLLFSHSVMSDSFVIPQTVAHQVPLSMGFPRQEYWSGLPFPPSGVLPDPGIKLASPALQADSLLLSHLGSPGMKLNACY